MGDTPIFGKIRCLQVAVSWPHQIKHLYQFVALTKIFRDLLNKAHKSGIGFQLLKSCFKDLKEKGFKKAYLWVLENNPTIHFYERTGAKKLEHVLEDNIGSKSVREFCYSWEKLDF
jgi:GNAT superfamily N-acetyltransferase